MSLLFRIRHLVNAALSGVSRYKNEHAQMRRWRPTAAQALAGKVLVSLLAPTAFTFAADLIGEYEGSGRGLHWADVWADPYPLGAILFMLALDAKLYATLGWCALTPNHMYCPSAVGCLPDTHHAHGGLHCFSSLNAKLHTSACLVRLAQISPNSALIHINLLWALCLEQVSGEGHARPLRPAAALVVPAQRPVLAHWRCGGCLWPRSGDAEVVRRSCSTAALAQAAAWRCISTGVLHSFLRSSTAQQMPTHLPCMQFSLLPTAECTCMHVCTFLPGMG